MKLTDAQRRALSTAQYGNAQENARIRFRTGETLRRLGLLDRLTTTIARAVYVERDCETDQQRDGTVLHEWYITRAGKEALASGIVSRPQRPIETRACGAQPRRGQSPTAPQGAGTPNPSCDGDGT